MPTAQTISCRRLNESCKIASVISGKLPSVQGEARLNVPTEEVRRRKEGWGNKNDVCKTLGVGECWEEQIRQSADSGAFDEQRCPYS